MPQFLASTTRRVLLADHAAASQSSGSSNTYVLSSIRCPSARLRAPMYVVTKERAGMSSLVNSACPFGELLQ